MIHETRTNGTELDPRRRGQRLEEMAMAVFLIMTGALWLAPHAWVPEGTWLAGVGIILLGLNAARRLRGLRASGFGIVAGACALAAGTGRILGFEHLFVPILLIALGAVMVGRAIAGGKNTPSAAEPGGKCC